MEAIVPYLTFNGNASEALAFYAKAFDGKTIFQQTFGVHLWAMRHRMTTKTK